MLYKIKATYNEDKLREFYTKLSDGTIASQEPDGQEMLASMKRAKIDKEKVATWYESCFCDVPLNHERTTVYDQYFEHFTPTLVEVEKDDISGTSFWEYMQTQ